MRRRTKKIIEKIDQTIYSGSSPVRTNMTVKLSVERRLENLIGRYEIFYSVGFIGKTQRLNIIPLYTHEYSFTHFGAEKIVKEIQAHYKRQGIETKVVEEIAA